MLLITRWLCFQDVLGSNPAADPNWSFPCSFCHSQQINAGMVPQTWTTANSFLHTFPNLIWPELLMPTSNVAQFWKLLCPITNWSPVVYIYTQSVSVYGFCNLGSFGGSVCKTQLVLLVAFVSIKGHTFNKVTSSFFLIQWTFSY